MTLLRAMTYPVNMSNCPDLGLALPTKAFSGPIGILWDMENCHIPGDVNTDDVAGNIRMALRVHPAVKGFVTMFSAYGDFNQFPRRLREGCQRTGINLIDVPNGRKDASDKAILVDMFLFALDNPPPCTLLLITGDVDFAPALHKLGQRGYTVLLALPAAKAVASALSNAGQYVWDWPSVARGEGFVAAKGLRPCAGEWNRPKYMYVSGVLGCQSSEDFDHLLEDEACMQGRYAPGAKVLDGGLEDNLHSNHAHVVGVPGFAHGLHSNQPFYPDGHITTTHMHTHTRHLPVIDTGTVEDVVDDFWAQPGDIDGLKSQLIRLLKLHGGRFIFSQVAGEYKKMYGRPLFLSEYGSLKLGDLLRRLGSTFVVTTIGGQKMLFLQDWAHTLQLKQESKGMCEKVVEQQKGNFCSPQEEDIDLVKEVILLRAKDQERAAKTEKDVNEREAMSPCGSAPEQEANERKAMLLCRSTPNDMLSANAPEQLVKLETFKCELQELLVSHAYRILLTNFWKVYHRRYARELDLDVFGATNLDDLLKKVQDVAIVIEEQGTQRKFLVVSKSMDVQHMV